MEDIDKRMWAAMVLVVLAGVLLAEPSEFGALAAAGFVALACVCWGLDNNLTAIIDGMTPAQTTLVKGLCAGGVNLLLGLWLERGLPNWWVVGEAIVVGAVGYGLSIVLYIAGAQQLGASRSQMLFASAPFLGCLLAWSVLGEAVHIMQVTAGLVMAVGIGILRTARHEHAHAHIGVTHTHSHRHDDGHHDHVHERLPPWVRHSHPHTHTPTAHKHPHPPDLHHRHEH